MRRTHAARTPSSRRQLAFEPLESRALLAADLAAWPAADASMDGWSWEFADWSHVDTAGEAWWGDAAWTGEVSWDPATDGGADGSEWFATDANGSDWSADFAGGDGDFGWSGEVTPPAADATTAGADMPPTDGVDVVGPAVPQSPSEIVVDVTGLPDGFPATGIEEITLPSEQPVQAGGGEATVTPESSLPTVITVDTRDAAQSDVAPGVEPLIPPLPAVVPDDGAESVVQGDPTAGSGTVACDVTADGDVSSTDVWSTDVWSTDVGSTDVGSTVGDTDDTTDDAWVIDAPSWPWSGEIHGSGAEVVVDIAPEEPVAQPTVVNVTPVAGGQPRPVMAFPVVAPAVVARPASGAPAQNRFASWGAMFLQAFGRPAPDATGSLSGGQDGGQPGGAGRPRLRLPFRPLA